MGATRASQATRMPRAALISWLALTVACVACSHPWDDYLASDGGQGGAGGAAGQAGSSPSAICTDFCAAYRRCVEPWSTCDTECLAAVAGCSTAALTAIQGCVDDQQSCTGQLAEQWAFYACMTTGQQCLQMQSPG